MVWRVPPWPRLLSATHGMWSSPSLSSDLLRLPHLDALASIALVYCTCQYTSSSAPAAVLVLLAIYAMARAAAMLLLMLLHPSCSS
jgi:hypothetical protein